MENCLQSVPIYHEFLLLHKSFLKLKYKNDFPIIARFNLIQYSSIKEFSILNILTYTIMRVAGYYNMGNTVQYHICSEYLVQSIVL